MKKLFREIEKMNDRIMKYEDKKNKIHFYYIELREKNNKSIDIEYKIYIDSDNYLFRIYNRNEFLYIDDELNNNIFRINNLIFDSEENKMNMIIIKFLYNYIKFILND